MAKSLLSPDIAKLLIAVIATALITGFTGHQLARRGILVPQELQTIITAHDLISDSYSEADLAKGAIQGMLQELGDPYAYYLSAESLARLDQEESATGVGFGFIFQPAQDSIEVISILPNSPASESTLAPGDRIIAINQKPVSDFTRDELVMALRPPVGTNTLFTLSSQASLELTSSTYDLVTIEYQELEPTIGYLKIYDLGPTSHQELLALRDQIAPSIASLIIDLRGTPGGRSNADIAIADEFLSEGIMLTEHALDGTLLATYQATMGGTFIDQSVIFLTDGHTASAAEVLIAALVDHGRAASIGTTTYGKGTQQSIYELPGRVGINITTANWRRPSGDSVQDIGIIPSIEVADDPNTTKDEVIQAAIGSLE